MAYQYLVCWDFENEHAFRLIETWPKAVAFAEDLQQQGATVRIGRECCPVMEPIADELAA